MEELRKKLFWFTTALIFFCIMETQGNKLDCCSCEYKIPNTTTLEGSENYYQQLVHTAWNQGVFSLTRLGQKFSSLMLKMAANSDQMTRQYSFVISYYFMRLYPFIEEKPSLCGLSKLINASVKCANENDEEIQEALDMHKVNMLEVNGLLEADSRYASGCDRAKCNTFPIPEIPKDICYKQGRVYNTSLQWNGILGTHSLIDRLIVLSEKLYNSYKYCDNLLAAISYFSNTASGSRLFFKTNLDYVIEAMNLQQTFPVNQYCCASRLKRIQEFYDLYNEEVKLRIQNEKNFFQATKCKNN